MKFFELANTFNSKPVVYLDMDGVLADFFGEVAREHNVGYWREIHRKDLGIDQVAQQPGFFKDLPPMPHAPFLVAGVLSLAGKYSILSSPLMSEVDQSSEEKAEWLDKHLGKHQPDSITFDHEKYRYAKQANGTPNILIDDWDTNIKLWELNGGIGILYKDQHCADVLKKLSAALHGKITPEVHEMAISENDADTDMFVQSKLYTGRQVLRYVTNIHDEYHMPEPILQHKTWVLKSVPVDYLKTPEYVHQDDPYRRVIDLDWDHIKHITMHDLKHRPIVIDANGWVLDGNHRATAARAKNLTHIPALMPYTE